MQQLSPDILNSSASLIFAADLDMGCTYINETMRAMLGVDPSASSSTFALSGLVHRDPGWFRGLLQTVAAEGTAHVELEISAGEGAPRSQLFAISPVRGVDATPTGLVFVSVPPPICEALRAEGREAARRGDSAAELERRDLLDARASSCVEHLRSCDSLSETDEVVFRAIREIFGQAHVELFVTDREAEMLELKWSSDGSSGVVVSHADCWAMRSRRPHAWWRESTQMRCAHDTSERDSARFCAPLHAHDGPFAIISLVVDGLDALPDAQRDAEIATYRRTISAVTARLSLALTNVDLRARLEHAALTDPLTGVFNRRAFERSVVRSIARSRRHKLHFGFVLIDVDHFKELNDQHGHEAGDKVLTRLSDLLTRQTRTSDTLARLGGGEFGLLLEGASEDEAILKAEELRKGIEAEPFITETTLTASLGVTHSSSFDQLSWKILYGAATRALYVAKGKGRNRVMLGGSGG